MSFVNPNTCHLICNNFNLNFIFGTVCLCVCVYAFSLRREYSDMILGDKPLISEVVLSQAISWSSSKQTVMTSSTMYVEFVACYEATGQVMWLKKFIISLRVVDNIERPLKLYCDNEPTVLYSHNNKKTKAVNHITLGFIL
jgi:hypothetical protein